MSAPQPVKPVKPGAEPFRFDGGPIGALLLHGFSGSPASMRPLGEFLAAHGVAVNGPRLPGHGTSPEDLAGTTWEQWFAEGESALAELESRSSAVICVGLSMGGALAVHMATRHHDRLRGLVVINPYVHDPRLAAAAVGRLFMKSIKGVVNDIKKPGQDEVGYDRIPTRVLPSLNQLLKSAESDLPRISLPLLVFSSPEDHTVKPANARLFAERAGSKDKELVRLANSYHVATLDNDAPAMFDRILAFAIRVCGDADAAGGATTADRATTSGGATSSTDAPGGGGPPPSP
jgi:carboxylesterase